ncbi:MAG: DUF393 domain-containing protein [Candidatus Lambdaproteobacteria bacterium]|nr:DUF393 domain-containing protein [Candidatus Lambdaproteobacteria bacterium]
MTDEPVPAHLAGRWLLLWDGDCGFCRRGVNFMLRAGGPEPLALPYQQALDWLPTARAAQAGRQVLLRAPDGRYWGGADAVIELLRLRGRPRLARRLGWPPLRALLRVGYACVARHRRLLSHILFRP